MSSRAGESSGGGDVAPEKLLLGPDDLLSPGDIGDLEEASGGVTVGVVRARSGGEASGQLGGGRGQGQGGEREDSRDHLRGGQVRGHSDTCSHHLTLIIVMWRREL